jgi:hypothetical protein
MVPRCSTRRGGGSAAWDHLIQDWRDVLPTVELPVSLQGVTVRRLAASTYCRRALQGELHIFEHRDIVRSMKSRTLQCSGPPFVAARCSSARVSAQQVATSFARGRADLEPLVG